MKILKRYYWILIAILCIALDQFTKWLIVQKIPLNDSIPVINGFFNLSHVRNTGAAFGILSGKRWIFMVFTSVVILAAVYCLLFKKVRRFWGIFSLSLIIGGGIGNMIDRVFLGEVIDFFAFNFWGYEFAVFNVADAFVCCGTVLLAVYILFLHESSEKTERPSDEKD